VVYFSLVDITNSQEASTVVLSLECSVMLIRKVHIPGFENVSTTMSEMVLLSPWAVCGSLLSCNV